MAGILLAAVPAPTVALGFDCLTPNDPDDYAIGESQLAVESSDLGGVILRFHFCNAGPPASGIAGIYFDDGALLALATVIDGPGGTKRLATTVRWRHAEHERHSK